MTIFEEYGAFNDVAIDGIVVHKRDELTCNTFWANSTNDKQKITVDIFVQVVSFVMRQFVPLSNPTCN